MEIIETITPMLYIIDSCVVDILAEKNALENMEIIFMFNNLLRVLSECE